MKLPVTLVVVLIAFLLASSCNKGPTGGIPFYLKMDTAVVTAPPHVSASSNTQGIQDVWVTAGSGNLGAYELPCQFPVLLGDSVLFVVSPGVWESGQSGSPVVYPLMNPDVFTLGATPGKIYTHVPTFTYKAGDTIMFNEDFEVSSDYNSNMTRTSDSAKYGHSCGRITVGPNDSSVTACQQAYLGGAAPYPLTPGQEIWVELDYKANVPLWSGIIAHFNDGSTDSIQLLLLLPQSNWTKVYLKLSETVGNEGAVNYNLFFQGVNPSGFAGGSAYLDNIRLIHLLN
jgi:hypothetical protein